MPTKSSQYMDVKVPTIESRNINEPFPNPNVDNLADVLGNIQLQPAGIEDHGLFDGQGLKRVSTKRNIKRKK